MGRNQIVHVHAERMAQLHRLKVKLSKEMIASQYQQTIARYKQQIDQLTQHVQRQQRRGQNSDEATTMQTISDLSLNMPFHHQIPSPLATADSNTPSPIPFNNRSPN